MVTLPFSFIRLLINIGRNQILWFRSLSKELTNWLDRFIIQLTESVMMANVETSVGQVIVVAQFGERFLLI